MYNTYVRTESAETSTTLIFAGVRRTMVRILMMRIQVYEQAAGVFSRTQTGLWESEDHEHRQVCGKVKIAKNRLHAYRTVRRIPVYKRFRYSYITWIIFPQKYYYRGPYACQVPGMK